MPQRESEREAPAGEPVGAYVVDPSGAYSCGLVIHNRHARVGDVTKQASDEGERAEAPHLRSPAGRSELRHCDLTYGPITQEVTPTALPS